MGTPEGSAFIEALEQQCSRFGAADDGGTEAEKLKPIDMRIQAAALVLKAAHPSAFAVDGGDDAVDYKHVDAAADTDIGGMKSVQVDTMLKRVGVSNYLCVRVLLCVHHSRFALSITVCLCTASVSRVRACLRACLPACLPACVRACVRAWVS